MRCLVPPRANYLFILLQVKTAATTTPGNYCGDPWSGALRTLHAGLSTTQTLFLLTLGPLTPVPNSE